MGESRGGSAVDVVSNPESNYGLSAIVANIYDQFGQSKPMGDSAPLPSLPHFFLLRTFAGENDLLVILNTRRCRYRCAFCNLPKKSSRSWVRDVDVVAQFGHVMSECKHA